MKKPRHDGSRYNVQSTAGLGSDQRPERILIVGGDSVGAFTRRTNSIGWPLVQHWSGRKRRDLARSIPRQTDAVIVVLDRVSHALARKIRTEATRRGLPVLYQKRAHVNRTGNTSAGPSLLHAVRQQ